MVAFQEHQDAKAKAKTLVITNEQATRFMIDAMGASAQARAQQAQIEAERQRRIQENAAGVSEGIRQAELQSMGLSR